MKLIKIKINLSTFIKNSRFIECENIVTGNDYVIINVSKNEIDKLQSLNINFQYIDNFSIKQKLIVNAGFIIGIILFFAINMANIYSIEEIVYKSEINKKEISTFLKEYQISFLGKNYLNESVIKINQDLRSEFSEYEWINIVKEGRKIVVGVNNNLFKNKEETTKLGDLIATKSGIIKIIDIEKGLPLITYNQYVLAGEKLVSGNLYDKNFVSSKGYVIAETLEKEKYILEKITQKTELTGEVEIKKVISFFGKSKTYENCSVVEKNILSLGFVAFKELQIYQKDVIINQYDEKTAKQFIKSKIEQQFFAKKSNDYEKIINILFLNIEETEDSFIIHTLTKKFENIAIFKES